MTTHSTQEQLGGWEPEQEAEHSLYDEVRAEPFYEPPRNLGELLDQVYTDISIAADKKSPEFVALVEACKHVLTGGNHVALLIGSNHPPYMATLHQVSSFYLPHHPDKYEAWICWRSIMQLRDCLAPFLKEGV